MSRGRYTRYSVFIGGQEEAAFIGHDEKEANDFFETYVGLSLSDGNIATDESVTLYENGEIDRNFLGARAIVNAWRKLGISKSEAIEKAWKEDWGREPPALKQRVLKLIGSIKNW